MITPGGALSGVYPLALVSLEAQAILKYKNYLCIVKSFIGKVKMMELAGDSPNKFQ